MVSFVCADGLSEIASCESNKTLSEGANQSATGNATDKAGNTALATVSGINVDKTKPTIASSILPAAADGSNGWYVTAPTVSLTCDDALSGVASCVLDGSSPASHEVTLDENALGQTVSGTATDVADNTETASVGPVKVDLSDPRG